MRAAAMLFATLLAACTPEPPAISAGGACDMGFAGPGRGACLGVDRYGAAQAPLLAVVLHGDVSGGGPATYHRALAQRVAGELPGAAVVAMLRPGYPAGDGRVSDGALNGRSDHYTRANMELVADAIAALKRHAGASRVIAVGHSGGAATAANILALRPGLLDGVVLLACPCDLVTWRAGRRPWSASMDPAAGVGIVPAGSAVIAFTGENDGNTPPALARNYVAALARRGVGAHFVAVPGAGHNEVVEAAWSQGLGAALRGMAGG